MARSGPWRVTMTDQPYRHSATGRPCANPAMNRRWPATQRSADRGAGYSSAGDGSTDADGSTETDAEADADVDASTDTDGMLGSGMGVGSGINREGIPSTESTRIRTKMPMTVAIHGRASRSPRVGSDPR